MEKRPSIKQRLGLWGAMTTGIGLLGLAGEKVQENVNLQRVLLTKIGPGPEEFLKGHAGDMAFVMFVPALISMTLLLVNMNTYDGYDLQVDKGIASFACCSGILAGGVAMAIELITMTGIGVQNCGVAESGTCRGVWGDVLAYSVPVIAGVWWLSNERRRRLSRVNN